MKDRLLLLGLLALLVSGCNALADLAPPPPATEAPTPAVPTVPPTSRPTLGELVFMDAVYCRESHIDDGEFHLIRFFPSGQLIDVFVQPYGSCQEAWAATREYLVEESLMQFSHGAYQLSGEWIQFTLSPPNSSEVVGEVTGTYAGASLFLLRQGAEEREYIRLSLGE
jgi:hypothetical protein